MARRRRRNGAAFKYTAGDSLAVATFSRASSASYIDSNGVLQTASSGVARDGHYINGVRSLLLEQQRTNLALQSGSFGAAPWGNNGNAVALTLNAATAPDGTNTATTTAQTAITAASRQVAQTMAVTAGQTITVSGWIQLVSGAAIGIAFWLNETGGAGVVSSTIAATSGWQRFSFTRTVSVGTTTFQAGLSFSYDANGGASTAVYGVWGMQVEVGGFASSYIATVGSTVTRSADSLSFPWTYGQQSATAYCSWVELGTAQTVGSRIFQIGGIGDPRWLVNTATTLYRSFINGTQSGGLAAPGFGHAGEFRSIIQPANGIVQYAQSVDGGAEVLDVVSGGSVLANPTGVLTLNSDPGGSAGFIAIRAFKIAFGVQSLATMRAI